MSKELEAKVWASGLQAKLKPVAAFLADIANADGSHIYPSVAYIAWSIGDHDCAEPASNERTVQRHILDLLELGILQKDGWYRRDVRSEKPGPGATQGYRLLEDMLPLRRPWKARYDDESVPADESPDKMSPQIEDEGVTNGDKGVTTHRVTTHRVTPVSPKPDPYPVGASPKKPDDNNHNNSARAREEHHRRLADHRYIGRKWEALCGIGTINSILAESFNDAEKVGFPEECVDHSFKAAAENNVRRWPYILKILEEHKTKGDCYGGRVNNIPAPGGYEARRNSRGAGSSGGGGDSQAILADWKDYAAQGPRRSTPPSR